MNKAPVQWSRGTWDYGRRENMGFDAIPTIYDVSIDGYTPHWKSGIGWGTDLFVSELILSGIQHPYYDITPPSGLRWVPNVDTGYFYLGIDEYYLYSDKGTTNSPTGNNLTLTTNINKYPIGPVTVTLGDSEFTSEQPFTKTYMPDPSGSSLTPYKFRRRAPLDGRRDYYASGCVANGIVPLAYSYILGDMQFSISGVANGEAWDWVVTCNPGNQEVTVEYETSDTKTYGAIDVDMNPYNSYEASNSFITVINSNNHRPKTVVVNNGSRYIREKDKPMLIIAAVKDYYGIPVSGEAVAFSGASGDFSADTVNTIWDGTASTWFTISANDMDRVITAVCAGVTGSLWVPGGVLS